jgi:RecA-family ATPase
VKRVVAATGKPPLVIVDSLVSFFPTGEDENSAVAMRAFFNRCRMLTRLGATVIVIHHTNCNGEARGSSDFKPACDQAFLVSNHDRDGGRLLDVITLKCEKSRYGLASSIEYQGGDICDSPNCHTICIPRKPVEQLLHAVRYRFDLQQGLP